MQIKINHLLLRITLILVTVNGIDLEKKLKLLNKGVSVNSLK